MLVRRSPVRSRRSSFAYSVVCVNTLVILKKEMSRSADGTQLNSKAENVDPWVWSAGFPG